MGNTTIPAELVAINAIQGTLIADNAITAVHIAQNQVHSVQLAINSVTATQIADGTITSAKIQDGTIATADIADVQITTAKLADNSVTSAKIVNASIVSADIANNAILTQHIDDNQITADQIADNAVGLGQMAGLTRGSIIYGDSAGNPAYLAAGTNGHVLTSDGTDISWTADTDLFLASSGGTVTGNIRANSFTAGTSNPNAELLFLQGPGHTGHGASNTVSMVSIAESTSGNAAGLWIGAMNNENTAVLGTRTASGNLAIQTYNGSWGERMRITYTGKVGIGTDTPERLLHVEGTDTIVANFKNTTATGEARIYATAGTAVGHLSIAGNSHATLANTLSISSPSTTRFVNSGVQVMHLLSSGNVGIGTDSPNTTLTLSDGTDEFDFGVTTNQLLIKSVTSDGSDDQRIIIDAGSGGLSSTRGAYIALSGNEASTEPGHVIYQMGNVTGSSHVFRKAGGTDAVTIDSSGNVGIGTDNPSQFLDVRGHTQIGDGGGAVLLNFNATSNGQLKLNNTELMRLDNSGQVTLFGNGGSHAYTVPQDQSLGYTNNLNAGAFGVLHRASYDSYVTGNTYYYKTGGSAGWRAKYGSYKSNVMGMVNGAFTFDCSSAAPGSNGASVSGLASRATIDSDGLHMKETSRIELAGSSTVGGRPIFSETDNGTHMYSHLCTGSFYQGSNQGVAINTNIPSHNVTGNNMFSFKIRGFTYDSTSGGVIDCTIGMYSGEGAFHNCSYTAQNIPKQWQGKIRVGYNSSNKVVILLGDTDTDTNYEIACDAGVQGFYGVDPDYFSGWSMSAFTSTSAYSGIVTIQPKETQMIGFFAHTGTSGYYNSNSSSWTTMSDNMTSVEYNFGGYLNTSDGKFTPAVRGMYLFEAGGWASQSTQNQNNRYAWSFAKNDSLAFISGGAFCNADSPIIGASRMVYLNGTGDFVRLKWFQSQAGTLGGNSHRFWWQGHLINNSDSSQNWTI